jgi:hypothetical protein
MENKLEQIAKPEYWHDLTEDEKRAIHNPEDYPIISVIKAIPQDILKKLDKLLIPLSSDKSFFIEETPWLRDFFWYKNEGKACDDSSSWDRMCIEYRLYFAAEHPDKIENPSNPEIKDFLTWIALGKEYYQAQAA